MRVEIVTDGTCLHGNEEGRCESYIDPDNLIRCPGGSRRVLAPGEYVLLRSGGSMAGHAGFVVCGECEGTGMRNNGPETSGIGRPDWFEEWPCPSCQGSGLVPTDELREKATDTLLHVLYLGADRSQLGSTQVRMHERAADAVLRVVAEHLRGSNA